MNNKIIIKSVVAVLLTLSVFLMSSCGSSEVADRSLLAAKGAGRIETSATESDTEAPDPLPQNGITICVDPGHGFDDPGSFTELLGDLYEKDITLAVAKCLKEHLEQLGFNVVMTHDGEMFPVTAIDDGNNKFRPEERVSYANSLGDSIDYYISLHCNYYPDSADVNGTRIYYYDTPNVDTDPDALISEAIANQLIADFPDDKTPTFENSILYVVKYTKVPASLIEMGFISNQGDVDKMKDPEWQDKFAESVAKALQNYYTQS